MCPLMCWFLSTSRIKPLALSMKSTPTKNYTHTKYFNQSTNIEAITGLLSFVFMMMMIFFFVCVIPVFIKVEIFICHNIFKSFPYVAQKITLATCEFRSLRPHMCLFEIIFCFTHHYFVSFMFIFDFFFVRKSTIVCSTMEKSYFFVERR